MFSHDFLMRYDIREFLKEDINATEVAFGIGCDKETFSLKDSSLPVSHVRKGFTPSVLTSLECYQSSV